MKFRSFRQRLNAAFLLASLVPTLLCSALLLQVFRIRMGSTQTQAAQQQLTAAEGALGCVPTHANFAHMFAGTV